ncbi:protochlorophyllide reductase [Saccharopolyspora lacisalsi]|uniref:Protochlorophyllide reductase n=1 Tax=Halosaccharopolyspora lacisalsi TaxID=1000566 RepID=A0A839E2D9_9PSEU|nr:oxidoreductase [Halosaccharopolyspora lacisalsi]MBA8825571.1 protochlorophyllide reductase [Halosaccharopolyspora lacisalsi]
MTAWTEADIPDQHGRTVLITGANSGLGLHSARALATRGARVLLACRSAERGRDALARVRAEADVEPELVELDLADLGSVRKAAEDVRERSEDSLDVLMNNAGVMAPPKQWTGDGFELQIGTNHLGHAALTWLLMPALRSRPGSRVVTLSSLAHHGCHLDTEDPNFRSRHYTPFRGYSQSKLANLLFMLELDRRVRHSNLKVISVAAHPGMTETELATNSVRARSLPAAVTSTAGAINKLISQPTDQGALPQLCAATAPGVRGGDYFGPSGFGEMRGRPKRAKMHRAATEERTAAQLWKVTSELTGVRPEPV